MATRDLKFLLVGQDKSASKTLRGVGKEAERTRDKFSGMVGAFAGGAAAAGVIAFGKASVQAFQEAQAAQERLTFAFEKFPRTADINIDALRRYNSALAKKTAFDDDAIASGQAVLAQFGLTGKQLQAVTPLVLDYAAATGQDVTTASTLLGKAMLGNTRALKEIGVSYTSTGNAVKDFEKIQALVTAKVGGFAEKEGKTSAGQLAILRNQFGEVQEEVGARLLPALTSLGQNLLATVDFVQRNSAVIKPLVITLGTLGAAVYTVNTAMRVGAATSSAYAAVKGLVVRATVAEGAAAGTTAVAVNGLALAETRAGAAGAASVAGSAAAAGGFRAVGAAASTALGPIGLLITGLVAAYNMSSTVRDTLREIGGGFKKLGGGDILGGAGDILGINSGNRSGGVAGPKPKPKGPPKSVPLGTRSSGTGRSEFTSNLYIDGKQVAQAVNTYNSGRGSRGGR